MKSTPIATQFIGIVKIFSANNDLQGVVLENHVADFHIQIPTPAMDATRVSIAGIIYPNEFARPLNDCAASGSRTKMPENC